VERYQLYGYHRDRGLSAGYNTQAPINPRFFYWEQRGLPGQQVKKYEYHRSVYSRLLLWLPPDWHRARRPPGHLLIHSLSSRRLRLPESRSSQFSSPISPFRYYCITAECTIDGLPCPKHTVEPRRHKSLDCQPYREWELADAGREVVRPDN